MPKASVIIPTYNGEKKIGACLTALAKQVADHDCEILVIDDGSKDETAAIAASFPGVTVITQPNAGPAAARNNGAKIAKGDIILFIDDDCIAESDWLQRMLAPFEDPSIDGAKGAYYCAQKELTARFVQIEYEEKFDELEKHTYIDFIDTYSAAFRKNVFLEFGGYDTSFPTASVEDQEFSFRLANAGKKMVFQKHARVWHTHINTPLGYLRKKFKIGYWKVLALVKNPNKVAGDSHTPKTLMAQIVLMLLAPFALLLSLFAETGTIGGMWGLAFLTTAIPLWMRALGRDPVVGGVAPFFILLRAVGLTVGLIRGMIDRYFVK